MNQDRATSSVLGVILPALLGGVLFAAVLFLVLLPQAEQAIRAKKREMIKEITKTAWSIVDNYHRKAAEGLISREEAQAGAISTLRNMRYGANSKDYFWINDLHPRMIMHPYRLDLVGKDLGNYQDPRGKRVFVLAARVAREKGAGFLSYYWQFQDRPGRVLPKISYVKLFKPWGWVIGTGLYAEDVEQEVAALTRGMTLISLGILLLMALISGYLVVRNLRLEKQRIAAQSALLETTAQYKAVLDGSPDPMVVYDNTGRTLYVNRAFTRVFGWSMNEVLGRKVDFVPPEEMEATMGAIREVYQSPSSRKAFDSRRYTKDGRVLDVIVSAAVYHGHAGDRAGMVVILKDVTEQRRTQQALIDSERKYRDLFDSITDLIYTQDLQGRFLTVNPALSRLFGYLPEELIGRRSSDQMKPELRQAFETEYLANLASKGHYFGTSAYFAKDGSKFYIEYNSNLVTPDHGEPYISGTGRDVTERVQSERQLKKLSAQLSQAQKMEAVGTLASGIAHDFNNILQGINGYIQLLVTGQTNQEEARRYYREMEFATQRGAELVRRLLAFSRKEPPRLSPLALNREVTHAVGLLERTVPKMINIQMQLAIDLWPVNGDPGQLEQVVMNLGSNAADAMPQGGILTVATENVQLSEEFCASQVDLKPGGHVLLTVSDTGHGMSQETAERIFEPFFTTKGANQGTGLGLSTAYGIVKSHGGAIICLSQPGQGTIFHVYLPALPAEILAEPAESPQPPTAAGGPETVLVVDDEPGILETLKAMLDRAGYRVLSAKSGEAALDIFREGGQEIDLVILDLNMPGMGGQACFLEMTRHSPSLKVIISSGYSPGAELDPRVSAGAAAFLSKPYSFNDLLYLCRQVLDQD